MDIYLVLLKIFAVLIALLFLGYALSALVVAIALGTIKTLRQAQEEEKLAGASSKRRGGHERLG
ncbi:MAG: hypothetical protein M3511_14900 [Deinococcota bacterium]|jgi:hypothetical protein|nr:hypothetical protein [Deinococcota bacterium]